jgi:hypothetical protein
MNAVRNMGRSATSGRRRSRIYVERESYFLIEDGLVFSENLGGEPPVA